MFGEPGVFGGHVENLWLVGGLFRCGARCCGEGVNVAVICLGWDVVTGDVMCCFAVDVAV